MRPLIIVAAAFFSYVADSKINDWTAIGPTGGSVLKIVYNPVSPSMVYLISVAGFSRSTDGGLTWQMISSDFENPPSDLQIDPSDPSRVYIVVPNSPYLLVSTDAGQTLKAVSSFPVDLTNPWQIEVSKDGKTLFVTAESRVICSTDRGQSWVERTRVDSDPSTRVLKLMIDPVDSNTLYASVVANTGANGIFVTHDGAQSWAQSTWSTNTDSFTNDFAINASDPNTVWTARFDGVWVTHDRGVTWTRTGFNVPAVGNAGPSAIAIAVDPQNASIIYAANPYAVVLSGRSCCR
jgi:photosystem II stability/assembly factor-like uncharacterized protein